MKIWKSKSRIQKRSGHYQLLAETQSPKIKHWEIDSQETSF